MTRMKNYRLDAMLTQYELADLARVARHRIQVAENGIPILTAAEAKRISIVFGLKQMPEFLQILIEQDVPLED